MKTLNAHRPSRSIRKTAVKRLIAIGLISSLEFVGAASSATLFFTYSPHNSSDLWSTGANWSSTPQSSLPTALIFGPSGTFSGAFSNTSTNDIGTGAFITSVLTLQGTGVSGGADTVTINSAGGNYLNLDSTIPLGNPQVNLNANPGSGGTLVYNVASPVTLGILPLLITGNGTADFRFSGVISGSVGINKSGASAVTFSGLNSYTGPTSVLGGTLIVGANAPAGANGALGNALSAIVLGAASGSSTASLIAGGAFTIGRDIAVQAGSSGAATIGGNTTSSSSFTGNITLSKDVTLQSVTTGTSAVTFSTGVISGGFGVTKAGSGTVVLAGANTYTGATTVNQGTLRAGLITQAFGVTSAVTMANTAGAILDLAGYNNTIGSLAGGGSTGGNVTLGTATLSIGTNNSSTSFAGAISGAGNIAKIGTGTLTLTGASSFAGTTSVLNGTLQIGASVSVSANGPLGNSSNAVILGDTTGSNGASLLTGGAFAMARDITVQAGSSGVSTLGGNTDNNSSFTGNITLNKNVTLQSVTTGANAVTFGTGIISGGYSITKAGSGTVILAGSNTYSGATNVTLGTLRAGVATQAFGVNSAVVLTNTTGVTLDLHNFNNSIGSLAGGGAAGGSVTLGSATLTTGGDNTTTTFAGIISGAGGLTKVGTGIQTLSGANSYTGATNVNGGTLKAGVITNAFGSSSAIILANTAGVVLDLAGFNNTIGSLAGGGATGGNVTLGSGILTTGGDNTTTTFSGIISGGGGLTKVGTGVLTLAGLNTYTGATTVNIGTLRAGVTLKAFGVTSAVTLANTANVVLDLNGFDNAIGSLAGGGGTGGNVTLGGATLTFGSNNSSTSYAGVISGTGGLIKVGTGAQTLTGVNTYHGTTTINAGTLTVSGGNAIPDSSAVSLANVSGAILKLSSNETIGSIAGGGSTGGTVNLGTSTLSVGYDNTSTIYNGGISGTGGVTKIGTGTLTVGGVNSYTGSTTVSAGTLQAGSTHAFGTGSAISMANVSGATLDLNNYNQTVASLAGGGSTGGNVLLGSGTLTLGSSTSTSYAGSISGSGGLIKIGSSTQTLTGANSYSGNLLINQGAVTLSAAGSLNSQSTLEFAVTGAFNYTPSANGSQTLNQLTFTTGDGTVQSTYAGSGTNSLTFNSLTRQVGATGNMVKSGGTAANNQLIIGSQTAGTLVDRGLFYGGSSYAAADAAGYLRAVNYGTDPNSVTVAAGSSFGAVSSLTNVQITGAISNQPGGTAINTLAISGNNNLTINGGSLTVNGILKSGGVAGGATISGDTGIQAATNQELVIRTDAANDTLTISTPILADGANALTKSGAGTLTLTGANTYTGVTTINAGTVQINGVNGLGDGSSTNTVTFNGGTLESTANTYDLGTNRSMKLNTDATIKVTADALTVSGPITNGDYTYAYQSSLTKSGAGSLTLTGNNTYGGSTTVSAGALIVSNGSAIPDGSAVTVTNTAGALLQLNNNETIGSLAGGGASGGNVVLGTNTLTTGGNGTTTTYSGVISGDAGGGLAKIGGGTQTLSGSSTYTGPTLVSAGTLKAGVTTQAFGVNSAVTVVSGATLDITGFNNSIGSLSGTGGVTLGAAVLTTGGDNTSTSYTGVIAGTGGVTKIGSGTQKLSGASSYTGTTTVNGGILQAGVATKAFGTGSPVTLADTAGVALDLNNFSNTIGSLAGGGNNGGNITLGSATLTVGNASSTSYGGVINGTGGLTKAGAGTLTLTNANTYTGATTINAGTLAVSGGLAISDSSAVTFANTAGAVLQLNSSETIGSLAGGGSTGGNVTLGSNTLTVGANNTSTSYAGAIGGLGGVTKEGTGTQTFTGVNTYSGATTINHGILAISGSFAIGDSSAVSLANTAGVALQVNSSETIGSLSGGGSSGGNVTVASTMTLTTGGDGTSTSYSGVISGAGGSLTKIGAGTQTLTANNSYTGVTTIQNGTLALSTALTNNLANSPTLLVGDIASHNSATLDVTGVTNAGGFHVLSGQTASGFGTYNAGAGKAITVDSGAHWAPGATGISVGTNSVTGNLALSGASDFNLGTPGSSHSSPGISDQTNVTGSLTLGGVLNLSDNANAGGNGSVGGGSYKIFTQNGSPTGSFSSVNNIGTTHAKVDTSTPGSVFVDIYRQANPVVSTVNVGSVHVGGLLSSSPVTVINNNPNDGYTEGLNASFGTPTGALAISGSPIVNLVGTDNTSFSVSMAGADTSTAGHKTGTVPITLASNGTVSGYANTSLTTQTLTVYGDVFRLASPNNITATYNLGYIHQGSTFNNLPVTITNGSVNDGFSEGLDANPATPTGDARAFGSGTTNLFGSFSGISVGVDTTTPGVKNGTVPFNFASNGTYSVLANTSLPTQTITVNGQVYTGKSTWNTNGGGNWSDVSKWETVGGAPGLDSNYQTVDTATFAGALLPGNVSVNLNSDSPSISALTFNNTAKSYTIAPGTGGGVLKLNGGGSAASVTDIAGSHTISAPVELDTQAMINVARQTDTLAILGSISNSGGINKTGIGTLALSGNNTYSGATTVSAGTLAVQSANAIQSTSSVTVNSGANLNLGVSNVQSSAPISLAGGTISRQAGTTQDSSNSLGSLILTADSSIDFGSKDSLGALTFTNFDVSIGNNLLTINNWFGTPGVGNAGDHLFFLQDPTSYLADITFAGYPWTGGAQDFRVGSWWEVTPMSAVPEPSAIFAGVLLMGAGGWQRRRQIATFVRKAVLSQVSPE